MRNNYKNIVVELLLIFSIITAVLSIFLKYVILNESTYLKILDKVGAYEQIKDYVYEKIDDVLSSKNINIDIKESIITEDDIKYEANNAISEVVDYLKTGENNVKTPDTSVYKQRVSDILNSVMDSVVKPNSNELSLNDKFQIQNTSFTKGKLQVNTMNYTKEESKDGQDQIKVEKLMSKSEAEARVREILKQKGLTEEQAIQKAINKGITEEQALKILASYGITIDDYESGQNNSAQGENSSQGNVSASEQDSTNNVSNEEAGKDSSSSITQNTINKVQGSTSTKSKLDNIKNKLLNEANESIDKEVEKMNLNKVLESSKLQKLAKITSTIYKLFWLFIIAPIIISALIVIKFKKLNRSLKYIGIAFLLAGLIILAISYGINMLKVYEKININQVYFKETIFESIRIILSILMKYGIIVCTIGLVMLISPIKKHLSKVK
jgi:hypothetical protein